ncbi:MAG: CsbD family protein [Actinomycetota bacterium]
MKSGTQTQLESKWDEMKGRVKEAWGVLTDDDLKRVEGKWDRLVSTIKDKTGETVSDVERKLDQMMEKQTH